MGHPDIVEAEAPNPPHEVVLSPFAIGVHPVTNAEYDVFVQASGAAAPTTSADARFGAPDRPVVGVSWAMAQRYCEWAGGALPTEAQWELAARGFDGRRYPWGDSLPDESRACYAEDWSSGGPGRVGERPTGVSAFGCHDMAGNVWEWCLDVFQRGADLERVRIGRDPVRRRGRKDPPASRRMLAQHRVQATGGVSKLVARSRASYDDRLSPLHRWFLADDRAEEHATRPRSL